MKAMFLPILGAALFLAGCYSSKPVPQPPPAVQVQSVDAVGNSENQARYSAVVMPDTQVPLAFRVPGYVVSLAKVKGPDGLLRDLAEGDQVSKGMVVASLRRSEYQDKMQQASSQAAAATAAAEKAQLDYDRANRLFASESLTKPEYDAARAQLDATQAQLRAAKALRSEAGIGLRDTKLVCPIYGEVVKKAVEVGSLAGPGTLGFVVADTRTVKIMVGVPDVMLRTLRLGMKTVVTTEALPNRSFDARITRISSAADPKTRNFDVEIAIPNRKHELKVGMIASVELSTGVQARTQQPVVPLSAIVQAPGGGYGVFIISNENGSQVARLRQIAVGEVYGNQVAASQGITVGEQVVTTGAQIVRDGQRVEVIR